MKLPKQNLFLSQGMGLDLVWDVVHVYGGGQGMEPCACHCRNMQRREDKLGFQPTPSILFKTRSLCCFSIVCAKLAVLQAFQRFSTRALGLHTCPTVPRFIWGLAIQMYIFKFIWHALCSLAHLPRPHMYGFFKVSVLTF